MHAQGSAQGGRPRQRALGERMVGGVLDQLPLQRDEDPRHQGDHVVGDGRDEDTETHQPAVDRGPAFAGGDGAEQHAEGEIDRGAADRDGDGGRQLLEQFLGDLAAGPVGDAEAGRVAVVGRAEVDLSIVEQTADEDEVLLRHRFVEPHLLGQQRELLGGALAVQVAQWLGRVAGALEEQDEHDHGRQHDDQERRQQPAHDVAEHPSSLRREIWCPSSPGRAVRPAPESQGLLLVWECYRGQPAFTHRSRNVGVPSVLSMKWPSI